MTSRIFHIQDSCKRTLMVLFFLLLAVGCNSNSAPVVEAIAFDDASVSFVDMSCSVQFTLVNESSSDFTFSLLTATFEDESGEIFQIEMDQEALAGLIDPITIPGLGSAIADITFDLSGSGLSAPITSTLIIIGVGNGQVTHFVGNFTCD